MRSIFPVDYSKQERRERNKKAYLSFFEYGNQMRQDCVRFFRNSIRPWVCWTSSKGLGVGLKFFGAKPETNAVSTEAGLVISALGLSSSSAAAVVALAGCFRRDPDGLGRFDVFGTLFASLVTSTASTIATDLGSEVAVATLTDDFLVITSSAMTTSIASPSTGAAVCSSTNVKSSSTNVLAAKVKHATAHKTLAHYTKTEMAKKY